MSTTDKKRELFERVKSATAKDTQHFVRAAATPKAIARHAYHSSAVEGRNLSITRLEECARRK